MLGVVEATHEVADEPPPPPLACGTHADVSNSFSTAVVKEPPQFGDDAYVTNVRCAEFRHARRIEDVELVCTHASAGRERCGAAVSWRWRRRRRQRRQRRPPHAAASLHCSAARPARTQVVVRARRVDVGEGPPLQAPLCGQLRCWKKSAAAHAARRHRQRIAGETYHQSYM